MIHPSFTRAPAVVMPLVFSVSVLTSVRPGAATFTYDYDPAGRLVSTQGVDGSLFSYTYDPSGNILASGELSAVDIDHDGLPDSWEMTWLGSLAEDGTDDHDGDGMSNSAEYVAGTNPADGSSSLRIIQLTLDAVGGPGILFTSVPGKRYKLQWKSTLNGGVWTDGATFSATSTVSDGRTSLPISATHFIRVVVVP